MSEEEIIKNIKEKLEIIKSLCTDDCINKSVVIEPLEYSIKGLLDLYNKEKEKNKYYEEKIINCMVNENFKEMYEKIVEEVHEHYISKDKIKDLIYQRKFELQQEYKEFEDDIRLNVLQELLEN